MPQQSQHMEVPKERVKALGAPREETAQAWVELAGPLQQTEQVAEYPKHGALYDPRGVNRIALSVLKVHQERAFPLTPLPLLPAQNAEPSCDHGANAQEPQRIPQRDAAGLRDQHSSCTPFDFLLCPCVDLLGLP